MEGVMFVMSRVVAPFLGACVGVGWRDGWGLLCGHYLFLLYGDSYS